MNPVENSHFTSIKCCGNINQHYRAPKACFQPVVIAGKLVFKIDLERGIIEWQDRGQKYLIDLATLEQVR